MAREFARRFYKSKAWNKCREAVMQRDHRLCVECGAPGEEVHHIEHLTPNNINDPNVTLNMDNLKTLCRDCHHKIHKRNQYTQHSSLREGVAFDSNGNLINSPH